MHRYLYPSTHKWYAAKWLESSQMNNRSIKFSSSKKTDGRELSFRCARPSLHHIYEQLSLHTKTTVPHLFLCVCVCELHNKPPQYLFNYFRNSNIPKSRRERNTNLLYKNAITAPFVLPPSPTATITKSTPTHTQRKHCTNPNPHGSRPPL